MAAFKVISPKMRFATDGKDLDPSLPEDFIKIVLQLSAEEVFQKEIQDSRDCVAILEILQQAPKGQEEYIASFLSTNAVIDRLTAPECAEAYFNVSRRLPYPLQEKIITAFYAGSHYCNLNAVSTHAFNVLKSIPKDSQTNILSKEGTIYRLWYNRQGKELCALLRQMSKEQKTAIRIGCSKHHSYLTSPLPPYLVDEYPPVMRALRL